MKWNVAANDTRKQSCFFNIAHLYVEKNTEHKASKNKSRVYLPQVIIHYCRVKYTEPDTELSLC